MTRWDIGSKKITLQRQQPKKASTDSEPQTHVISLCLGKKKLFPVGSVTLLWKLFLSAGVPLFMSSTVTGEKMESSSRPFSWPCCAHRCLLRCCRIRQVEAVQAPLLLSRSPPGGFLSPLRPTWVELAQTLEKN